MAHIEAGWPEGTEDSPKPPAEQQSTGAMRSWLVHGTRKFAIDRRRSYGLHGESRRLLAAESAAKSPGTHGTWQDLVAALQRQAIHHALAQLRKADRQILTLAYLQGRTNREIAALLGVSVSTVRRRISSALARLDEYVRQARIWVTSLAVFAVPHARPSRWPGALPVAAAAAAAAAAVVTVGLVAVAPDTSQERRHVGPPPPAAMSIGLAPRVPAVVLRSDPQPEAISVQPAAVGKSVEQGSTQAEQGGQTVAGGPHKRQEHKLKAEQKGSGAAPSKGESGGDSQGDSQEQGSH